MESQYTKEIGHIKGIDLTFRALREDIPIGDTLDIDDGKEVIEKLEAGELVYFCAEVVGSKNGIKLSSDYLGACIYKDYEEFLNGGDYIDDMKKTVVKEALEAITNLLK